MTTSTTNRPPGAPAGWRPCTAGTRRCEYWTWGKDYLRPECCTAHLRNLLFFTEDLLARNGIAHWLDYGTLLGAVRGEAFVPWDTDVDLGVFMADLDRIRALEGEIARAGHVLDTGDPTVWRIALSEANTQHVDLYPWWEEGGLLKMRWPGYEPEFWAFPPSFLKVPGSVRLYGRLFPAPDPTDGFLSRYRYGTDFLTPRRPVTSRLPRIAPAEHTPAVGALLDEIRERDVALQERRASLPAGPSLEERSRHAFAVARARLGQLRRFEDNLRLLHDALTATSFHERYWVIGGLLIGWAREGAVLAHDARDADFGYWRADRARLADAAGRLLESGFELLCRWDDNRGEPVEYTFGKDGAKFEFFEHRRVRGAVRSGFFCPLARYRREVWLQFSTEVPAFRLAPMEFLGRNWLKPDDHDTFLAAVYGDWRVRDPDFDLLDDRSVIGAEVWKRMFEWKPRPRP